MIPDSLRLPVTPAPSLKAGATVGDLGVALDGQTAKLDQANGRTADVIQIVGVCDAHNATLLATLAPKPPWWRFWARPVEPKSSPQPETKP